MSVARSDDVLVAPKARLPDDVATALHRARVLAWLTIAYLVTAIVAVGLTMGRSEAMKTAWVDDLFSLVPPISFLVSRRIGERAPTGRFPYGFQGAASVALLASAVALTGMGLFLIVNAASALVSAEHPTIGSVLVFGRRTWAGYPMLAALVYSGLPAVFLGRAKKKYAKKLHDHGIQADAAMNEADWLTAVAAIAGVVGIGLGAWWADGVAAIVIACDILWDGATSLRGATNDVLGRRPRDLDGHEDPLYAKVLDELRAMPWVDDARVRLRPEGHLLMGEAVVVPKRGVDVVREVAAASERLRSLDWRLLEFIVAPVEKLPSS